MTPSEQSALLARLEKLDAERTQGNWECGNHPARPDLGVVKPIMMGNRVGKFPAHEGGAAYFCHYPDAEYIAAMPQAMQLIRALVAERDRKDEALLLAARWFKINFDDETLHEHPPSKADLAGMFDAMQKARLS